MTNAGGEEVTGWKVHLSFSQPISLVNGWNAKYQASSDGLGLTAVNEVYNARLVPSQSTSFGLQGGYNGSFEAPSCEVLP